MFSSRPFVVCPYHQLASSAVACGQNMDQSLNLADWHYIGAEMSSVATQTPAAAIDIPEVHAEEVVTAIADGGSAVAAAAADVATGGGAGLSLVAVGAFAGMGGLVAGMMLMRWRHKPVSEGIASPAMPQMPTRHVQSAVVERFAAAYPELMAEPELAAFVETYAAVQPPPLAATPDIICDSQSHVDQDLVTMVTNLNSSSSLPADRLGTSSVTVDSNSLRVHEMGAGVVPLDFPRVVQPALAADLPPPVPPIQVAPAEGAKSALPSQPEPPAVLPAPPVSSLPVAESTVMAAASTSDKSRLRDYAAAGLVFSVLASSVALGIALRKYATFASPAKRALVVAHPAPLPVVVRQKSPEVMLGMVRNFSQPTSNQVPVFERAATWVPSKCALPHAQGHTEYGSWQQSSALPATTSTSTPPKSLPADLANVDSAIMSAAFAGPLGPTGHRANVRIVGGVVRPAAATSSRIFRILPGQ